MTRRFHLVMIAGALALALTTLLFAYQRILVEGSTENYCQEYSRGGRNTNKRDREEPIHRSASHSLSNVNNTDDGRADDESGLIGGGSRGGSPLSSSERASSHEAHRQSHHDELLDTVLSAEGDILNSPFVDLLKGYYNGTRSFSFVCAVPTQKRIELKAMTSEQRLYIEKRGRGRGGGLGGLGGLGVGVDPLTFYSGEHFIIRDVCALGHFPKELAHLFTHVWRHVTAAGRDPKRRAELIAEYDELMIQRNIRKRRANSSSSTNGGGEDRSEAEEPVDDLEKLYYILAPRVAPHVIIGNACVCRAPPGTPSEIFMSSFTHNHKGNMYSGVFHKVMVHWIRAIMYPWLDAENTAGAGPTSQYTHGKRRSKVVAEEIKEEVRTYHTDAARLRERAQTDESAKYFPFGKGGRITARDIVNANKDTNGGGAAGEEEEGKFVDAISFYEDYLSDPRTQSPRRPVCFERLYEREERWRWFPNFEVAHRFRLLLWRYFAPIKAMQRRRIHRLLTVPFPLQSKLKLIVLRRDEDRHFNERQTAEYLKERFGDVADVKMVQYDSGGGHKPPPFYHQAVELATADVVIAAHGAALSSATFMRPGAVLVELFPHNFRYYMYEELAKLMGLNYVAYEGERVSPNGCCGGRNWVGSSGGGAFVGGDGDAHQTENDAVAQDNAVAEVEAHRDGGGADVSFSEFEPKIDQSHLLNFSSKGDSYVQMSRSRRIKLIGKIYDLHGSRSCKKCDIEVSKSTWYEIVKNALASVWLANSRLSNLHDFDLRR